MDFDDVIFSNQGNFEDPLFKLIDQLKCEEISEKPNFESKLRINLYLKTALIDKDNVLIK